MKPNTGEKPTPPNVGYPQMNYYMNPYYYNAQNFTFYQGGVSSSGYTPQPFGGYNYFPPSYYPGYYNYQEGVCPPDVALNPELTTERLPHVATGQQVSRSSADLRNCIVTDLRKYFFPSNIGQETVPMTSANIAEFFKSLKEFEFDIENIGPGLIGEIIVLHQEEIWGEKIDKQKKIWGLKYRDSEIGEKFFLNNLASENDLTAKEFVDVFRDRKISLNEFLLEKGLQRTGEILNEVLPIIRKTIGDMEDEWNEIEKESKLNNKKKNRQNVKRQAARRKKKKSFIQTLVASNHQITIVIDVERLGAKYLVDTTDYFGQKEVHFVLFVRDPSTIPDLKVSHKIIQVPTDADMEILTYVRDSNCFVMLGNNRFINFQDTFDAEWLNERKIITTDIRKKGFKHVITRKIPIFNLDLIPNKIQNTDITEEVSNTTKTIEEIQTSPNIKIENENSTEKEFPEIDKYDLMEVDNHIERVVNDQLTFDVPIESVKEEETKEEDIPINQVVTGQEITPPIRKQKKNENEPLAPFQELVETPTPDKDKKLDILKKNSEKLPTVKETNKTGTDKKTIEEQILWQSERPIKKRILDLDNLINNTPNTYLKLRLNKKRKRDSINHKPRNIAFKKRRMD